MTLLAPTRISQATPPPCACGDDLVPGLDVLFGQGSHQLTDGQRMDLRQLADRTRSKVGQTLAVVVTAYLDADKHNRSPLALAEQRTRAVKIALAAQGLPHEAIIEQTEVKPRPGGGAAQVQVAFVQLSKAGHHAPQ